MTERNSFTVGHWTDREAQTGCTVFLFDKLAPAAFEARGGAPGTRETDLLESSASVRSVDAILLAGGSAPGLAAADGVVRYLRERQRGYPTPAGPIPIVPAAVIFDLATGRPVSPKAEHGYTACLAATMPDLVERGAVGAGTGARTGMIVPTEIPQAGGFGAATVSCAAGSVSAYIVVNAAGQIVTPEVESDIRLDLLNMPLPNEGREATTIGVVITDAAVDHRTLERMTVAAHDGMARVIRPCHTPLDGDAIFAVGLGEGSVDLIRTTTLMIATELAVERAILDAVQNR